MGIPCFMGVEYPLNPGIPYLPEENCFLIPVPVPMEGGTCTIEETMDFAFPMDFHDDAAIMGLSENALSSFRFLNMTGRLLIADGFLHLTALFFVVLLPVTLFPREILPGFLRFRIEFCFPFYLGMTLPNLGFLAFFT